MKRLASFRFDCLVCAIKWDCNWLLLTYRKATPYKHWKIAVWSLILPKINYGASDKWITCRRYKKHLRFSSVTLHSLVHRQGSSLSWCFHSDYAHTITMAGAVKDPLVFCFYPGTAHSQCNRDYDSPPPKSFGVHIPLEIKSKLSKTKKLNRNQPHLYLGSPHPSMFCFML